VGTHSPTLVGRVTAVLRQQEGASTRIEREEEEEEVVKEGCAEVAG
jgi:hypothetical protein